MSSLLAVSFEVGVIAFVSYQILFRGTFWVASAYGTLPLAPAASDHPSDFGYVLSVPTNHERTDA